MGEEFNLVRSVVIEFTQPVKECLKPDRVNEQSPTEIVK